MRDLLANLKDPIPVLDKGFVRLVDVMPRFVEEGQTADQAIVQAARVSYGAGTKTIREDRALIHYLMRHQHTSPFEQVEFKFHMRLPIFVARQMIRHRTASVNEESLRYSEARDEFYLPPLEDIRAQSTRNRQGRAAEPLPEGEARRIRDELEADQRDAYARYRSYLERGVARELARINLPVSLLTSWYWKIDLHNLFHFLKLRLDPHAQHEIRLYAQAIARYVRAVAPVAYEAFEEHVLYAARFSRTELAALRRMLRGEPHGLEGRAAEEFLAKLEEPTR
ncbi:MAG TPA: FAD-dependent thymidylate synthase [Thermodesulfobacteriota bacterium]|nr:FAD-dependent thymidylate synthase [Thermodesulfobacteriota bacterium]